MLVFALISVLAIRVPEVEDPIPAQIGLGHIFAFAAGGGVLGGISFYGAPPRERERAISAGSLIGFCIGLGFYLLSLVIQVASAI